MPDQGAVFHGGRRDENDEQARPEKTGRPPVLPTRRRPVSKKLKKFFECEEPGGDDHNRSLPPPTSLAIVSAMLPDEKQTALRIRDFLGELCTDLAPDFVVIGGWAAYAHGSGQLSLDGDALISYSALGTLRDRYEVTPNERMR